MWCGHISMHSYTKEEGTYLRSYERQNRDYQQNKTKRVKLSQRREL